MSPSAPAEASGLYVHVPFCVRACPYCDFDFEVGRVDAARVDLWLGGLEREWLARRAEFDGRAFDSLYIGGGTPSAIGPVALAGLVDWLSSTVLAGSAPRETTVELNPEHVDRELVRELRAVGVDRVSLGVQSLDAVGLRQLGRAHTPDQAVEAIEATLAGGLRTSVDLIVGWPGHGEASLIADLDRLVGLGVEHVSIYALTIEPEVPWQQLVRRGLRVLPDDDVQASLLVATERRLAEHGFVHYEVASYARPGRTAWHNGKYWRSVDVIGIGPSAASVEVRAIPELQLEVLRRRNHRGLERWLAAEGSAGEPVDRLVGDAAAGEALWLGLRRLDGLEVEPWLGRFGLDRGWLETRVQRQVERGNLEWRVDPPRSILRVAPGRWLWHDDIATDLV